MPNDICGYRRDLENVAALAAGAQPNTFLVGDIDPKSLGAPIGLIDVVKLENQVQLSSCAGNSSSSIIEACLWHQSGGQVYEQLSRMFAYVNGQKHCGISGDQGATLKGVIDGIRAEGLPLEDLAPYTGAYYTRFSEEAKVDAQKRKLVSYSPITDVDQVYEGLAKRIGGAFFGAAWCGQFREPTVKGTVDKYHEDARYYGFHAVYIGDWCKELDEKKYPRLRLFNSHGKGYGDRGTSLWSRDALNDMIHAPNTTAFFLSEMKFIKPRFDFSKQKWTDVD